MNSLMLMERKEYDFIEPPMEDCNRRAIRGQELVVVQRPAEWARKAEMSAHK